MLFVSFKICLLRMKMHCSRFLVPYIDTIEYTITIEAVQSAMHRVQIVQACPSVRNGELSVCDDILN